MKFAQIVFLFIAECKADNKHVNGILKHSFHKNIQNNDIPGWDIDCTDGNYESVKMCSYNYPFNQNWFCYKGDKLEGSIKTTLVGNGRAKLDFGNCDTVGSFVKNRP